MSRAHPDSQPLYWRSLAERKGEPEFLAQLEAEFPRMFDAGSANGISRRRFLQVMGASVALASLSSCRWPQEEILPFGRRPESYQPGRLRRFASALEIAGVTRPVLVSSYDGRPIKIEGHPDHPLSQGATDVFGQAAVLELYDPDRARYVRRRHAGASIRSTWDEFDAFARAHFATLDGRRLAVLSEATTSPSVFRLRRALERRFPAATWCTYEPIASTSASPRVHLDRARVIVDFDADLLGAHPEAVRLAREFASGRALRADASSAMNRLYVFEPTFSVTGSAADHRVAVDANRVGAALALLASLVLDVPGPHIQDERLRRTVEVAARDLLAHRRESVVVVGGRQPAEAHALAAHLNEALGNAGHSVTPPVVRPPAPGADVVALADRIARDEITTLVVLGGNPAHDAPPELGLADLLERVPHSVHLTLHANETSHHCGWTLPRAHPLESWGDAYAADGSLCAVQPLIAPLHGGRTVAEVLAQLAGEEPGAHRITRDTFHALRGGEGVAPDDDPSFEESWRRFLHDGHLPATTPASVVTGGVDARGAIAALGAVEGPGLDRLELQLIPDRKVLDGRFANHAWLQELPDPITKLTWDNAALVSPALAEAMDLRHEDVVRLQTSDGSIEIPVMVMPGQATFTVTVALGYGRTRAGRVGDGVGVDAYPLRSAARPWGGPVQMTRTGRRATLACTQDHFAIDTRGRQETAQRVGMLAREGTLSEYREHPGFAQHLGPHHPPLRSLWTERQSEGHRWGMAIDLNACIGCNACVVACVAENNIPVVGKEQVSKGREMQWLRIDRYFKGDPAVAEIAQQPVACAHCEMAPCEQVCPVGATMHSEEGLNVMAYNRCVGTRYCSNNCPYKVRRFNFFDYHQDLAAVEELAFNPEVTVRSRGVMEKCTYCVQRIEHARIDAKNEGRPVRDGDVVPACAQTCPAQAIVFGDLNDSGSGVAAQHENDRAYALLGELNLKPRTVYLARVRNPHPELTAEHGEDHGEASHHG